MKKRLEGRSASNIANLYCKATPFGVPNSANFSGLGKERERQGIVAWLHKVYVGRHGAGAWPIQIRKELDFSWHFRNLQLESDQHTSS